VHTTERTRSGSAAERVEDGVGGCLVVAAAASSPAHRATGQTALNDHEGDTCCRSSTARSR
jgi:hypothetical protein